MQGGGRMKIFYKQSAQDLQSSLSRFGIQNCYFKRLSFDSDNKNVTKKSHHHTGFEMHFITEGFQEYEVNGKSYMLESGCFLIIYPIACHKVIASAPHTQKYSITFDKQTEGTQTCFFGAITERITSNLDYISNEVLLKKEISSTLIENNILEILVWAFRLSGMKENESIQKQNENVVISLAKQYIKDNDLTASST